MKTGTFIPKGCRPRTLDEINKEERQVSLAKRLGISLDTFDDSEDINSQKEKDKDLALYLISADKPIPKDLETRLLKYKEEDSRHQSQQQ